MANLFIDPIVMASPQYGCSRLVFEGYIRQLIQWQELSDCEWSKIFFSAKTIDVLFSEQRYPIWDEVERIINGFGMDHIQRHCPFKCVSGASKQLRKGHNLVRSPKIFIN